MQTALYIIHCVACVLIILAILIQKGKGADISASFGGSSQTVFGTSGGANFLTRTTTILAAIFMLTSLTITTLSNKGKKSVFEGATPPVPAAPTTPAPTASGAPAPAASAAPAAQTPTPAKN